MSDQSEPTTSKTLELTLKAADISEMMFLEDLATRDHPESHRIVIFRKLAILEVMGVDIVSGLSPVSMYISNVLKENNVSEEDATEVMTFVAFRSPAAGFVFYLTDVDVTDEMVNEFLTCWPIAKAQFTALYPTAPIGQLVADLENYWSAKSDDILQ